MSSERKLVFVYNANSGTISLVKDFWHKLLKPSTYQCNLCMQTFGTFGMKNDWKKFVNSLNIDVEFLHKNEFKEKYKISDAKYPSTYIKQNGSLDLLISQDEMDNIKNLEEIEALVLGKLDNLA